MDGSKGISVVGRLLLCAALAMFLLKVALVGQKPATNSATIGREMAVPRHLKDDEEFSLPLKQLLEFGRKLFTANWTEEEGAGRPKLKGTGTALSDPSKPLVGS